MSLVLIVDDNSDNLYMLRKLLEGHHHVVIEARHGSEALIKAEQSPPALVISDLLMPVMDGYTLLKQWRATEKFGSIPFVVYTATYTDSKDERLAMNLGADAFIIKPSEPEPFMARIREVLAKNARGELVSDNDSGMSESALLKDYSEVLIRKLEEKVLELEQANSKLLAEVAERQKAEHALRENEEKLSEAVRLARLGYWTRDLTSGVATWSDMLREIFGIEKSTFVGTLESFLALVHPDDQERVKKCITDAESASESFDQTYRVVVRGEVRVIHEIGHVISTEDGRSRRLVGTARDVTKLNRAEQALRMRDRAIQAVSQGIVISDCNQPDNPIVYASPGFEQMTGYSSDEVAGRNCRFLQGGDTDPESVNELRAAIAERRSCSVEILNYRKDGTEFWNRITISPVMDDFGNLTHFVGVLSDVTERRNLEGKFRQVQKMEAIGQLAGGIAHDFNNLLTVINGYSEVLIETLQENDPNRLLATEIYKAGQRSEGLTRQLLTFSRRQVTAPAILNLNEIVGNTDNMLRRLIGEDIHLATKLDPNLWAVRVDPGQMEQVLMNLVVNARDAMPEGGHLTIETANVELDDTLIETHPNAHAGPHVQLSMTDTGSGIAPELQGKIFEPFFTTKGPGQGTGLGLSIVYGIVTQSGGHISVYSEIGVGTVFKVYLPRTEQAAEPKVLPAVQSVPRGTETILLIEDDESVRSLTRSMLTSFGYQVLDAADGDEAMRIAADHNGPLHMLMTDVVIPRGGGRVAAERVTARFPGIPVLYVSGYTDDAIVRHGILDESIHFLAKPFSPATLATRVRAVLDQKELD